MTHQDIVVCMVDQDGVCVVFFGGVFCFVFSLPDCQAEKEVNAGGCV